MHAFRKASFRSSTFWLIALSLASLLFARPLHEAMHLSERSVQGGGPVASMQVAVPAPVDAGVFDVLDGWGDGHTDGGDVADACVWCLVHAQVHAMPWDWPTLAAAEPEGDHQVAFHGRAAPPSRHWPAAQPRGPPVA